MIEAQDFQFQPLCFWGFHQFLIALIFVIFVPPLSLHSHKSGRHLVFLAGVAIGVHAPFQVYKTTSKVLALKL
jgi:hypothetical protein